MHYFTKPEREKMKELARKYRVSYNAIKNRLKKGNYDWSKIDFCKREVHYKYFIDGRPALEIARENGISGSIFGQRIRAGWSIKRACTFKEPSLKEISRKTGLSMNQIQNYVYNKGIPKEELLNGTFNNTRKNQG